MLFLFDKNENFYDEIPVDGLASCVQTEPLNGIVSLSFIVTTDYIDRMKKAVYVGHRDAVNDKYIQVYKIVVDKSSGEGIRYDAVHIVHDELSGYGYIRERRLRKTTAAEALRIALEGSRWQIGNTVATPQGDVFFYDNSRQEAVAKILSTWAVELGYRLVFDKNKITARYIDIYKARGVDTGRRYVYGLGALSVVRESSQERLYTAAIGRGKGEEKFDESGEATGGYGRRIDFKEIEWSKAKGDPVDKPKGQEFVELPERTREFGYPDGVARLKVVVYDDIEEPGALLKKTYDDLLRYARPFVQFESTIEEAGELEIGDRVAIIRKDLDIHYYTRVYEIERDLISHALTKISLGDRLDVSQGSYRREIRGEVEKAKEQAEEVRRRTGTEVAKVQKTLTDSLWDDNAYYYRLDVANPYHLPPGLYTFDRPIDKNPTKVIFFGAGKMAVSNKKDSGGNWIWSTWATGDGFTADLMRAGTIRGGNAFWDLETGELNLGDGFTYSPGTGLVITGPAKDQLKGEKGERGETGSPGKDGAGGAPGIPGKDGLPGKDGKDGAPGKDGKDGLPGKDGKDGSPGRGVARIVQEYVTTDENDASAPSGGWVSSPPREITGKTVWRRLATTFSDGSLSYTTPERLTDQQIEQAQLEAYRHMDLMGDLLLSNIAKADYADKAYIDGVLDEREQAQIEEIQRQIDSLRDALQTDSERLVAEKIAAVESRLNNLEGFIWMEGNVIYIGQKNHYQALQLTNKQVSLLERNRVRAYLNQQTLSAEQVKAYQLEFRSDGDNSDPLYQWRTRRVGGVDHLTLYHVGK